LAYITLKLFQPNLDLLNVVADAPNHGLKQSRYRNTAMRHSGRGEGTVKR
jgi:hypothetical protein